MSRRIEGNLGKRAMLAAYCGVEDAVKFASFLFNVIFLRGNQGAYL